MAVRKLKIVLIEDSPTARRFYQMAFVSAGFEVLEADCARLGWNLIRQQHPDIIVLDMLLPDVPGIEVLKKIRFTEHSKDIPVIVLTSLKEIDHIQEAIIQGASYYSIKGKDTPEKIMEMIYKLIKKLHDQKLKREADLAKERELDAITAYEEDYEDIEFIKDDKGEQKF